MNDRGITADIQRAEGAVNRTVSMPNNNGAQLIMSGISDIIDTTSSMLKNYKQDQTTNRQPITDTFLKLKEMRRAGLNDSMLRAKEDEAISALSKSYSYSDIKAGMEMSGYSPFRTIEENDSKSEAARQQSYNDMLESAFRAVHGDVPDMSADARRAAGAKIMLTNDTAKNVAEQMKNLSATEADKLFKSKMSEMYQEHNLGLTAMINANGGKVNQNIINAFNMKRQQELVEDGLPLAAAATFVRNASASYQAVADMQKTDLEAADNMQKVVNDLVTDENYYKLMSSTFTMKTLQNKDGTPVTGAQLIALDKFLPTTMKTLAETNTWGLMDAVLDNTKIKDVDNRSWAVALKSGVLQDFIKSKDPVIAENGANMAATAADKLIDDVANTNPEELAKNDLAFNGAVGWNKTYTGLTTDDIKANDTMKRHAEDNARKGVKAFAIGVNKVTDGEGAIIIDRAGNPQYIRYNPGDNHIYNVSNAGLSIPWGDQDAIAARDKGFAVARETYDNMTKLVGAEKAREIFNEIAVTENESLQKYVDYKRQRAENPSAYLIKAEAIGMTEQETKDLVKEAEKLKPGFRLDVLKVLKDVVTAPGEAIASVVIRQKEATKERAKGIQRYNPAAPTTEATEAPVSVSEATVGVDSNSAIVLEDGGKFILIPNVIDGKKLTDDEAADQYDVTGFNFGVFSTRAKALKAAENLAKRKTPPVPGLKPASVYGNIDLSDRPVVTNSDGSISTLRSITIEEDGKHILIPTIINGKIVSDEEAIQHYHKTNENLGKFSTAAEANKVAKQLSKLMEQMYK